MRPGITVDLMGHSGTGLILAHPTGISYVNQAGGVYCLQPTCQGIFVPWLDDVELGPGKWLSTEDALAGLPWEMASSAMTPADADGVDGVLRAARAFQGIRVDRARLAESYEAWVHVEIEPPHHLGNIVSGVEPFPRAGVLIWTKSD
jgi:hypothetical protein